MEPIPSVVISVLHGIAPNLATKLLIVPPNTSKPIHRLTETILVFKERYW